MQQDSYAGQSQTKQVLALLGGLAIVWTVLPTALTSTLPRDTLEALYWANAGWISPKHPPLAPFLADIAFRSAGVAGVYGLGAACIALALGAIFWLGCETFSPRHGAVMMMLSAGVALLFPLGYEFNPNIILLPFWALVLVFGWRAISANSLLDWALLGLCAGLGVLAKYTILMACISVGVAMLSLAAGRARLLRPIGPALAASVAVIVTFPHALAVRAHDFVTLHVAARDTLWEPERRFSVVTLADLAEFLAGQIGLSLLVLIVAGLVLRRFSHKNMPELDATAPDLSSSNASLLASRRYLLIVAAAPFILTLLAGISGARTRGPWGLPLALMTGPLIVALAPTLVTILGSAPAMRLPRRLLVAAIFIQPIAFAIYFIKPSLFGARNPLREHVDGQAVAAIAQEYWNRSFTGSPPIVLGLSGGALERQAIGSASLFMPQRPPAYQFFWVIRYGNRNDPELERFILERDWPWIDESALAARGGLALGIGPDQPRWQRLGQCLGDWESRALPVTRMGHAPQTLWLARLLPLGSAACLPPPSSYRDAMGLPEARRTMDRFSQ
jgi:4-amino-4-deoxy-L-arabinose transferase-like glycosyltransferase